VCINEYEWILNHKNTQQQHDIRLQKLVNGTDWTTESNNIIWHYLTLFTSIKKRMYFLIFNPFQIGVINKRQTSKNKPISIIILVDESSQGRVR